ncbi:hypothetical protein D3C71_1761090 [compost metagenome]
MTGFIRHRWHRRAAEFADKSGVADAQALFADYAFQAKARRAVHFFSGQRRTAKGAGDRVFGTVFQCGGEAQALIATQCAERADRT